MSALHEGKLLRLVVEFGKVRIPKLFKRKQQSKQRCNLPQTLDLNVLLDLSFVIPQPIYLVLCFFLLCLQLEDFLRSICQ